MFSLKHLLSLLGLALWLGAMAAPTPSTIVAINSSGFPETTLLQRDECNGEADNTKLEQFRCLLPSTIRERLNQLEGNLEEKYQELLAKAIDRKENLSAIFREFLRHIKDLSKGVIKETREFFSEYREELASEWDELLKEINNIPSAK